MHELFYTQRLLLRKFTRADAPFIQILLNSEGWLRFIGDRNIQTRADAEQYIAGLDEHFLRHGFGPMLVSLKETQEPIGMCSLIQREGFSSADIGFAFLPEHGGKGYAYEASLGTYHYARKELGLQNLCAITNLDNEASIRLLQKLGFKQEKQMTLPGETEPVLFFIDSNANT